MARSSVFLFVFLVFSSCAETILTDVSIVLPSDDPEASADLEGFQIDIYPASSGVCLAMISWRHSICGQECTDPPLPEESEVLQRVDFERRDDGSWGSLRLGFDGQGSIDIVVTGQNSAGDDFLYGCLTVSPGETAEIHLWRPWCDVSACAGQFHPACPVEIDCEFVPDGEGVAGLSPPICHAQVPVVWSWEQAGRSCAPESGLLFAPCYPARILCIRGMLEPDIDGICPSDEDIPCGSSLDQDRDCDGRIPGPCSQCEPDQETNCDIGVDPNCVGVSQCTQDGVWGECRLTTGTTEQCNGLDDDCDGISDWLDPDAVRHCNEFHPERGPVADRCDPDTLSCMCGSEQACENGHACCHGNCVDLNSDNDHCGLCDRACNDNTDPSLSGQCCDGQCYFDPENLPVECP